LKVFQILCLGVSFSGSSGDVVKKLLILELYYIKMMIQKMI